MKLQAAFEKRALVHSEEIEWLDSPMPGVQRRPLDRIGDEVARATSIVRYAPGSHFSPHVHTGGEEFLVLDGVFQDEHGDYPAGTYVRNPPGSSHTPASEPGCTIFVKLWQFEMEEDRFVRIPTDCLPGVEPSGQPGVSSSPLYQYGTEKVSINRLASGAVYKAEAPLGGELLVLKGGLMEAGDSLHVGSWLRVPCGYSLDISAGGEGATVWLKTGHLGRVDQEIERLTSHH